MMGIKETPINVKTYYKLFISSAKKKAEIARDMLSANREELGKLNKIINNNLCLLTKIRLMGYNFFMR